MAKKSVRLFGEKAVKVVKVAGEDAKALAEYLKKAPIRSVRVLSGFAVLQHAGLIIMSCEEKHGKTR